jgi:hypothetical protein
LNEWIAYIKWVNYKSFLLGVTDYNLINNFKMIIQIRLTHFVSYK